MSIDNKMRNYLEHKNNVISYSNRPVDYIVFLGILVDCCNIKRNLAHHLSQDTSPSTLRHDEVGIGLAYYKDCNLNIYQAFK